MHGTMTNAEAHEKSKTTHPSQIISLKQEILKRNVDTPTSCIIYRARGYYGRLPEAILDYRVLNIDIILTKTHCFASLQKASGAILYS